MTPGNLDAIDRALQIGADPAPGRRTIDITTTGARTGLARRIEISFWQIDGVWYLASGPGPRSWYANLLKHPQFTVHVKHPPVGDATATATNVTDPVRRRRVLIEILWQAGRTGDVDQWALESPLVEFTLDRV